MKNPYIIKVHFISSNEVYRDVISKRELVALRIEYLLASEDIYYIEIMKAIVEVENGRKNKKCVKF